MPMYTFDFDLSMGKQAPRCGAFLFWIKGFICVPGPLTFCVQAKLREVNFLIASGLQVSEPSERKALKGANN